MSNNTSTVKAASGAGGCFSIVADRAQEAIAVLAMDGMVHYANATWVRMHGYQRRSEVVGKRITDFYNKEQISEDILPFLQEVGRRGQFSGPVGHIHSSGKKVPTNTTMVALKDEMGEVRGVIVFATDISDLEQLKEETRKLEGELKRRAAELKSVTERLQERAREMQMVENLLSARGAELSSVNEQLWQYMSAREQTGEQSRVLSTELADKEKELTELKSQLQRQIAEQMRIQQQWKTQHNELTAAIKQLRLEVIETRHREVEFLEDIDLDAKPVGARGGLDSNQLKELSNMAKKFVSG